MHTYTRPHLVIFTILSQASVYSNITMDKSRCVTVSGLPVNFDDGEVMAIFRQGAVITGHARLTGKLIIEFESSSQAEASFLFAGYEVSEAGSEYTIDVNETTDEELGQVTNAVAEVEEKLDGYDLIGGGIKSDEMTRMVKVTGLPANYSDKPGHELLKLFGGPEKIKKSFTGTDSYLLEFATLEDAQKAKIFEGVEFLGKSISVDDMTREDAGSFNLKLSDDEWVRVESKDETISPEKEEMDTSAKNKSAEEEKKRLEAEAVAAQKKADEQAADERRRREAEETRKREKEEKERKEKATEEERIIREEKERKAREEEKAFKLRKEALDKEEKERLNKEIAERIEREEWQTQEAKKLASDLAEKAHLARVKAEEEAKKQVEAEEKTIREDSSSKFVEVPEEEPKDRGTAPEVTPEVKADRDADILQKKFSNLEEKIKKRPDQPLLPKSTEPKDYARPQHHLKATSIIELAQDFVHIRDREDGIEKALILVLVLIFLRAVWITVAN